MKTRKEAFLIGCKHGIPLAVGYLSISITFGVLAVSNGMTPWEATAMSVWVFAGASQFIAVNLLATASTFEIILATFILNLRHLLMSTTLARKIQTGRTRAAVLSFGITDETFVVATVGRENERVQGSYFAGIALTAYLSWVIGTVFGGVFGEFIPPALTSSMGIALYSMFIALLTPALKESIQKAMIAGGSALICTLCYYLFPELGYGWAIVISTIVASSFSIVLTHENNNEENAA